MPTSNAAIRTRSWLRDWVVALDLCPFAAGPLRAGRVRVVVSEATDMHGGLTDALRECERLVEAPVDQVETTVIALPDAWHEWEDFLDALAAAESVMEAAGLDQHIQIVGFHPDFRFADSRGPDDAADRVNRAPFSLLHLLRVEQVAHAIDAHPSPESIPARNAALLRAGSPGVQAAWRSVMTPDESAPEPRR